VTAWPQVKSGLIWTGFLFGLPLILIGFLLAGHRWAFMAGVMYGTIGLALDISTAMHELGRLETRDSLPVMSGLSGLLNILLIVAGGRGFLDVGPVASPPAPREAPPPNPPSPFST
jgi:hypothetical protein